MSIITEKNINRVLDSLASLESDPFFKLCTMMDNQQKNISKYLIDVEPNFFNEEENYLLFTLTALAWHIINESVIIIREVHYDELIAQLDANVKLIEKEVKNSSNSVECLVSIAINEGAQPVLMSLIVGLLVNRPKNNGVNVRDAAIPIIILHVKTVVDCLTNCVIEK
ncbi:MAG: hypothetical protein N2316_12375 [Spirochaetes bacterium]|nr:hypothetical protein [Spirochaetota bacterium]